MNTFYKKISLIIGAFALITIIQAVSCNPDPIHVKWANSEFTAMEVRGDSANNFYLGYLGNSDTVYVEIGYLGFKLKLSADRIVSAPTPRIIQPAYAFSFSNHYILDNRVDSVRIYTLRDYDAQHLAHSNVNDLMDVFFNYNFVDFETVIRDSPYLNYSETSGSPAEGEYFTFEMKLNSQPTLDSIVQFESRVYFTNRKLAIDTCQFVHLTK